MEPDPAPLPVPDPRHALDVPVLVRCTHDLLASRVPLTLLLDLADEGGPRSRQRYADEPADLGWLQR